MFQQFEKIEINGNLQLPDSTVMPNQSNSPQTTEPTQNIDNSNSPSEELTIGTSDQMLFMLQNKFRKSLNLFLKLSDQVW